MLTNQEANYLLGLEKNLIDSNQVIDLKNKSNTIELISHEDADYKFRLDINSNHKILLKVSIHHMESNSHIGLLRMDFKGGHRNPIEIKETLPENLKVYAGKWFNPDEAHMHVYVEGYRPLVWAIPLEDTDFEIKEINDKSDLSQLITSFANRINVNSKLNIQHSTF